MLERESVYLSSTFEADMKLIARIVVQAAIVWVFLLLSFIIAEWGIAADGSVAFHLATTFFGIACVLATTVIASSFLWWKYFR